MKHVVCRAATQGPSLITKAFALTMLAMTAVAGYGCGAKYADPRFDQPWPPEYINGKPDEYHCTHSFDCDYSVIVRWIVDEKGQIIRDAKGKALIGGQIFPPTEGVDGEKVSYQSVFAKPVTVEELKHAQTIAVTPHADLARAITEKVRIITIEKQKALGLKDGKTIPSTQRKTTQNLSAQPQ